jgi:hypothetical protein
MLKSSTCKLISFNREFPPLANGDPDFANASSDDLHTYLRLLTNAYETKAAFSSGCESHFGKCSSRKLPEQLWR